MMICVVESARRLNMRQLLNPIFFSPVIRHPDMTRQRKAKQRARELKQARIFKLGGGLIAGK
jgi:hypothetical protein